jgi:hypothetical protein
MGFGNFAREVLASTPMCVRTMCSVRVDWVHNVSHVLTLYNVTGIAAANYLHVNYFPSCAAKDAFYTILLQVVNISFEKSFYVQALLVQHQAHCHSDLIIPELERPCLSQV